jgi:membrane-associated phospholipid phosphatase
VLRDLVGAPANSETDVQLSRLAERISESRVVAGVHYPEDITTGKALGLALADYFEHKAAQPTVITAPATSAVDWLWKRAYAEWH